MSVIKTRVLCVRCQLMLRDIPTVKMTSKSTEKWRVPDNTRLIWVSWDDEFILFHSQAGKTHYLNQVGAVLLQELETNTYSVSELAKKLEKRLGLDISEEFVKRIESLLARFDHLGLVSKHSPLSN